GADSAVDAVLAEVHAVDTFAVSPAWMARDDDVPARLLTSAPGGDRDGAADATPLVPAGGDRPLEAAPRMARPEPPTPQPTPTPQLTAASTSSAVLEPPQRDAGADGSSDDADTDTAPDANLSLLTRLVSRARSS
ncbi:MAG TPA: hypothetical protein VK891_03840, partial [Euzebyales bacterium]|nr:hypothetical protein [Euzebyales bacterium]